MRYMGQERDTARGHGEDVHPLVLEMEVDGGAPLRCRGRAVLEANRRHIGPPMETDSETARRDGTLCRAASRGTASPPVTLSRRRTAVCPSSASAVPPGRLVQEKQGPGEGRRPVLERDAVRGHSRDLHSSVPERDGGLM